MDALVVSPAFPIRLLIVDDIWETRENLRKLIQFEDDIETVGDAATGYEGLWRYWTLRPDVVITNTEKARQLAAENGLDLDLHRSQRVEDLDLNSFDLILVMQAGHQEGLRAEFPDLAKRIHLLASMAGPPYGVHDPAGEDIERYRRTWTEIEGLIEAGFQKIIGLADSH